ncbi:hypothetical protein KEM55_003421 [Ascosphaera atra]|nr:hypothetical protein KEM55_003421 [Ascosphaera atra]
MSLSELTPFERWTYIPPESEPVAPADLLAAYYAAPGREAQPEPASVPNEGPPESTVDSYTRVTESESQFSLDRATTTTRTTSSAYSQHSSLASSRRGGVMRRRRYKPRATNTASSTKAKKAPKQFQCTFCLDSFSTKYDWQRHERTQHLALDSWTCTPLGGIEFVEGVAVCAFCRAIDPSNDHLEEHNYAECRVKNCFDRSFFRKDHLNQHLRLVHGVKYSPWMDEWKRTREHIQSRCGFCTKPLYSWKERVEHIADHYKAGACMKNWKGGLGFPPDVQQLVESTVVYPSPNALSAQGADKANTLDGAIFGTAQAGHEQTNASQRRSTFAPSNLSSVQYADSSSSGSMSAGGTTPEQTWGAAPQEPLLMNHSFSPPVYTFPNYSTACQTPEATFAFSGVTAPDAMIPGKDYPLGFSYPIGKLQPDQNFHESGGMVDTRFSGALAPHAPKS